MRVSLRTRMLAMIVVPTLAIYVVILGFAMLRLREDARHEVEAEMTRLASGYAARFDGAFRAAAAVATTTGRLMETADDLSERQIFAQLSANTRQNPSIYGAAMAFEPGTRTEGDELYCPYVHRQEDGINEMFISREVYDWYADEQWQWWHLPKKSGAGAWTDPYFDEGAGNVLMVTYSEPFFRDGGLYGITTVDIMLPTLRESVGGEVVRDLDFVILTSAGQYVFSPNVEDIMKRSVFDDAEELNDSSLKELGQMVKAGAPGVAVVDRWDADERTWVFYAPIESTGWSFAARVPERVAMAPVQARMAWASAALGFTLLLIVGCIWIVSGRIVRPIERLRSKVHDIAQGDLDAKVEGIERRDEIGDLAASFNRMTEQLRVHVDRLTEERVARGKIERDLDLARDIQRGLLPRDAPDLPGFEISGWNQAADKTGGDFFDWLKLPDGRTILTLADVTGHGIGPALIVAVCRAYLRASASSERVDLCEVMNRVNDLLHADIPDSRFVTAVVGIADPRNHHMTLVSAGQAPIFFYESATKTVHTWAADVMPLGIARGLGCDVAREFIFAPGDTLVLLTDGFLEWLNSQDQQYGQRRLVEYIRTHHAEHPREFIQALYDEVRQFGTGIAQADDLTALVIRRAPSM